MLVRDNMPCPFCGKNTAMDISTKPVDLLFSELGNSLAFKMECYECLAWKDIIVDLSIVRGWCRLLTSVKGLPRDFYRPDRWHPNFNGRYLRSVEKHAVYRSALLFFEEQECRLELSKSLRMMQILHTLRISDGFVDGGSWESFCENAWASLSPLSIRLMSP